MSIPLALNGVGRIGRALLRVVVQRPGLELVAVNDLASASQLANLVARDTIHGPFSGTVEAFPDALVIDGRRIPVFNESDPQNIPWLDLEPRVIVDATGACLDRDSVAAHLRGSVQKVVVSANAKGMDLTLCMGINQAAYEPQHHHLLSGASCTTNCLAPMVKVLDDRFGLRRGLFNTVHSYNNDQRLLSYPHSDPRRARTATLNMIPTSTSASQAIHRILPGFEGRLDGFAVRVPTPNVSLIDLVADLEAQPAPAEVNLAFSEAARDEMTGILAVTEEELVSSDFLGDAHSAILDLSLTVNVEGGLTRIVAWYDNEFGHASRLADTVEFLGETL
jgi:glyceraldehyde 3-phosphate dehydrogenase